MGEHTIKARAERAEEEAIIEEILDICDKTDVPDTIPAPPFNDAMFSNDAIDRIKEYNDRKEV